MLDLRIGGKGRKKLHHALIVRRGLEVEDEAELEVRTDDGTRLELGEVHADRGKADEDVRKRARTMRQMPWPLPFAMPAAIPAFCKEKTPT